MTRKGKITIAGTLAVFLVSCGIAEFCYLMRETSPFLQRVSALIEDYSVKLAAKDPQSGKVVVADIDEKSIEMLGQWPWPRVYMSELVHGLRERGAAVVAFDVLFAEPDRCSPEQVSTLWKNLLGDDAALPAEIREAIPDFDGVFSESLDMEPTVLGAFFSLSESGGPESLSDPLYLRRWVNATGGDSVDTEIIPRGLVRAEAAVFPLASLREASRRCLGAISTTPDYDRVIRRTPLLVQYGSDKLYPALSVEAVRLFCRRGNVAYHLRPRSRTISAVNVYDLDIRVDHGCRAVLNYRRGLFPQYSAADILSGNVPEDAFKGKIVFVGTSAAGLYDLVSTPLGSSIPGVQVHAVAADNILTGDLLHTVRLWPAAIALSALVACVLAMALPAGVSSAGLLVWLAGIFMASVVMRKTTYAASPFEPMLACVLAYAGCTFNRFFSVDRQRRAVRKIFGSMVSPELLKHLESMPGGGPALAGERRDVTILFTDIESFTSISEKLEPMKLTELLREYFTPMTDICLKHGAYINKFIGDAIMAVYNVPVNLPDHATAALLSAAEMQSELERLRPLFLEKYGVIVKMRIGIHTGTVVAGNMGSEKRFEYTVLGDTVNLASRLEGENKKHSTEILFTKEVLEKAEVPKGYEAVEVGEVSVRNRAMPAFVYTLRTANSAMVEKTDSRLFVSETCDRPSQ